MKLLNHPCSQNDKNTLPTRKHTKLHQRINIHTQAHINTCKHILKQLKIKLAKIGLLHKTTMKVSS